MLWRHSTAAHTYDPDNLHSNLFERQLIFEGRAKYKLGGTRKTCKVHCTRWEVHTFYNPDNSNLFERQLIFGGWTASHWPLHATHTLSCINVSYQKHFTRASPSINCTAWFCQIWKCSYLMVFPTNTKTSSFSLHVTHTLCSFLFSSPEASLGLKNPIVWFFKSCGKCVLF